jgi:hypothetical protein
MTTCQLVPFFVPYKTNTIGYYCRIPEHSLFWTGTYGAIAARSKHPVCVNRGEAKGHAPVATMP